MENETKDSKPREAIVAIQTRADEGLHQAGAHKWPDADIVQQNQKNVTTD